MITISRALKPASKISTYQDKEGYLFPLTDSTNWHDIYACLDDLDKKSGAIQKRMNLKIDGIIGRSTEVAYYDVTNYFFEIAVKLRTRTVRRQRSKRRSFATGAKSSTSARDMKMSPFWRLCRCDNTAAIKSEKVKCKQFIIEYNVDEETGEILTPISKRTDWKNRYGIV